jgi:TPR repeat protein
MNSLSDNSPEMNSKVAIGQLELGLKSLHGDGVPQNHATAAFWFQQSAELGNAEAMRHLASLYFSGNGVPHSHADAYYWVKKSYEAGDLIATAVLSEFHGLGIYVNPDPVGSLSLLEEASFRGHAQSQGLLKDFRSWWEKRKS